MSAAHLLPLIPALIAAASPGTRSPLPRPEPSGKTRAAVLVLKTGDVSTDFADGLTELLIIELAKMGRYEMVGKEAVKDALGIMDEKRALSCLASTACLGTMGSAVGATKAVVGTVGREAGGFSLSLALIDLASGESENRLFTKVPGGERELVAKLQAVAIDVATPRPKPGTLLVECTVGDALVYVDERAAGSAPATAGGLAPGRHEVRVVRPGYRTWRSSVPVVAGDTTRVRAVMESDPLYRAGRPPKTWASALAWSSTGLAVAFGAVGGVLFSQSYKLAERLDHNAPDDLDGGYTYPHFEDDATRSRTFYRLAWVGVGIAAACAGLSIYLFAGRTRDVFGVRGRASAEEPPPRAALRLGPGPGPLGLTAEVTF